ncbi:MAG: aldose 1-epimerase [Gemmataceae bacterium]|nr:aldose 1-epimerase [Gemmataceae bacterium]
MSFRVRQETRTNALSRDPTVWVLDDGQGSCVEIWPALGFNAYRWCVAGEEILYRDAAFFDELKPTRSGIPILFPFPNRIRAGRFTWEGKSYQLPLNDSAGANAIHGFVVRRPWRVTGDGADAGQAWVTAEFDSARDAADAVDLWPAAYLLRITYRLMAGEVRIEAAVENPAPTPLPFGLGYHPYFRVAPFGGDQACIDIEAGTQWKLVDNLPTGATLACNRTQQERRFADVHFDDLFTDVPFSRRDTRDCGAMESAEGRRLVVEAARDFRELVVFTPPHRQAICFEPYTCITDAINLHQQGIDTGLQVLAPGDVWHGWVQIALLREPTPAA